LRALATSTMTEFVTAPLAEGFGRRAGRGVEVSFGVAAAGEMPVLVANRLADLALGPYLGRDPGLGLVSEPVFRGRMVVVGAGRTRPRGGSGQWPWLVDQSGTDPDSDTSRLLRRLGVPERRVRVFANQTAAWEAAAEGGGGAPAVAHLVAPPLRRGELSVLEAPATPMAVRG